MGMVFCCLCWRTADEEDEVSNGNDDVVTRGNNCLERRAIKPRRKKGFIIHQREEHEPGPAHGQEPVLEDNGLITCNSILHEDISRDEECPICFEEYTGENPKIIATCSHHYHLGCIYDWQERSGLCPSCLRVMEFQEIN